MGRCAPSPLSLRNDRSQRVWWVPSAVGEVPLSKYTRLGRQRASSAASSSSVLPRRMSSCGAGMTCHAQAHVTLTSLCQQGCTPGTVMRGAPQLLG